MVLLPVVTFSDGGLKADGKPLHGGEWSSEVESHNHCL